MTTPNNHPFNEHDAEAGNNPEAMPAGADPDQPDQVDEPEHADWPEPDDVAERFGYHYADPNASSGIPMPLGIIEAKTADGATFTMTRPDDHEHMAPGDSVTVWDIFTPLHALARYRGTITEVNETTAAFAIQDQEIDESWPATMDPISPGNAVYLAQPDSYTFDGTRVASFQELGQMQIKAAEFQARTGITTGGPGDVANRAMHLAGVEGTNAEQAVADSLGRPNVQYHDADTQQPDEPEPTPEPEQHDAPGEGPEAEETQA